MERLASLDDVQAALGYDLDEEDIPLASTLLAEATALVRVYARGLPSHVDPVPDEVKLVVARMAARALSRAENAPLGASQATVTAGPFTQSQSFPSGTNDGGVWLSKMDKIMLGRWRGGAFTVRMY